MLYEVITYLAAGTAALVAFLLYGVTLAPTTAFWDAQDSVFVIQRVKTGASTGFEVKPIRQPVIAQVFDAPSEMIVRSYIPGSCAIA